MNKLIYLHSVELGAALAYSGHASNAKDWNSTVEIVFIMCEEKSHRRTLRDFIYKLNGKPSKILDGIFWLIGKSVSISCYILPYWAANKGAALLETMAIYDYNDVASQAEYSGYVSMAKELRKMAIAEQQHKAFFEGKIETV